MTKLIGFAVALLAIFGLALGVGRAVGPGTEDDDKPQEEGRPVSGLTASQHGYTIRVDTPALPVRTATDFKFAITKDGATVTDFTVEHDKRLHLIVVRRDGTRFQHVHPEMAADGTWGIRLALPDPGTYRVFADFHPTGGEATVLGADITAAGDYQPAPPTAESRAFSVDGYDVKLDGALAAGASSEVRVTVTKAGKPVDDLQPYLGAYGHLVSLRASDLAYLHVHPEHSTTAGPDVAFAVEVPTTGRYRLFFDFQHEGKVRTAEFTVEATDAPTTAPSHGGGHGH